MFGVWRLWFGVSRVGGFRFGNLGVGISESLASNLRLDFFTRPSKMFRQQQTPKSWKLAQGS